jgi:hypothetical protein
MTVRSNIFVDIMQVSVIIMNAGIIIIMNVQPDGSRRYGDMQYYG